MSQATLIAILYNQADLVIIAHSILAELHTGSSPHLRVSAVLVFLNVRQEAAHAGFSSAASCIFTANGVDIARIVGE
jgi:hypothetical protein